jgi:hypothetical protein
METPKDTTADDKDAPKTFRRKFIEWWEENFFWSIEDEIKERERRAPKKYIHPDYFKIKDSGRQFPEFESGIEIQKIIHGLGLPGMPETPGTSGLYEELYFICEKAEKDREEVFVLMEIGGEPFMGKVTKQNNGDIIVQSREKKIKRGKNLKFTKRETRNTATILLKPSSQDLSATHETFVKETDFGGLFYSEESLVQGPKTIKISSIKYATVIKNPKSIRDPEENLKELKSATTEYISQQSEKIELSNAKEGNALLLHIPIKPNLPAYSQKIPRNKILDLAVVLASSKAISKEYWGITFRVYQNKSCDEVHIKIPMEKSNAGSVEFHLCGKKIAGNELSPQEIKEIYFTELFREERRAVKDDFRKKLETAVS